MKIISGGQRGADIAGLRAAKKLGFQTGGWMPSGYRTTDGPKPEYAEMYGMETTMAVAYPTRTLLNVMWGDVTLRFASNFHTYGEKCTFRAIEKYEKHSLDIALILGPKGIVEHWTPDHHVVRDWLQKESAEVINIAGNSQTSIEPFIERFLLAVFEHKGDGIEIVV